MSFFTSGVIPSGVVLPYAGATAPNGWLLCYGQNVSRTTYSGLFAAISTTYGAGDGSTTFGLPDLRGRTPFGRDDMGGVAANRITNAVSGIVGTTLGATGGNEIMHQHSHGAGTFATTLAGTFASSAHTHTAGTLFANFFNSGNSMYFSQLATASWTASRYIEGSLGQSTGGSISTGMGIGGSTNTPSATSSLTGSNTVAGTSGNAGTGASQNIPPAIIMNQIIKV